MSVRAVVGAALSTGLLGVGLGQALGRRRGLAFAAARGSFEKVLKPLDASFQLGDAGLLPHHDLQKLVAGQ